MTLATISPKGWVVIPAELRKKYDLEPGTQCARSFSITVKGTLAIVLLAKQRGLIPSAADLLRALRTAGFRIDDHIAREVLSRTVGEEW